MKQYDDRTHRLMRGASGQSLVEYTLIAVILLGGLFMILVATGPAIGNVFSNTLVNLIGADTELRDIAQGPTAFWETVEAVSNFNPTEKALATNAPRREPTQVPPDWTPPTATPVSPTWTPSFTPTPSTTPSPTDLAFAMPFYDPADNAVWYRLSDTVDVGHSAWKGIFYQDINNGASVDPFSTLSIAVENFDPGLTEVLGSSLDVNRLDEQDFSVKLTRSLLVPVLDPNNLSPIRIGFRLGSRAGGTRVALAQEGQTCSALDNASKTRNTGTRAVNDSGCLLMDDWVNTPGDTLTTYRDLTPGQLYTLYIEHYHLTGTPQLNLEILSPKHNPDDAGLNGQAVQCDFGRYEGDRSNSRRFAWKDSVGLDEFPDNQRCYLELRGHIAIADNAAQNFTLTTPVLSFWEIWDLNGNTDVSLQVAQYDTSTSSRPIEVGDWTTVWSRTGGTRNYEWTQQSIDLSTHGFTAGTALTYRFVVENDGGGGGRKRWYVDDVRVDNVLVPNLSNLTPLPEDTFTVCENRDTCDSYWTMDDFTQKADFRTTGRWDVASGGGHTGMAWTDDKTNPYSLEPGSGLNTSPLDQRVYYIEFNKRLDLTNTWDSTNNTYSSSPTDHEGHKGAPILSFYNTYAIEDNATLAIQYYDDANSVWKTLRTVAKTGANQEAIRLDVHQVEIDLSKLETVDPVSGAVTLVAWEVWKTQALRMRFAFSITERAVTQGDTGWTIDNILIERFDNTLYRPYPLYDSAGDRADETPDLALAKWSRTGTWGTSTETAYGSGRYSYSDSPGLSTNYISGSISRLELRGPLDLLADSPNNPYSPACVVNPPDVEACETTNLQVPAVNPTLSFWWHRALATNHGFSVEIIPDAGQGTAITIWEYVYNANDAVQTAWEYTEIALDPFIATISSDLSDIEDDIVISFKLDASIVGTGDVNNGISIDEIRLQDAVTRPAFKLWHTSQNGDGSSFKDTIDDRSYIPTADSGGTATDLGSNWQNRWRVGGKWSAGDFTPQFAARSGVLTLHESPPLSEVPSDPAKSNRYTPRTYNTVEMIREIDMTGLTIGDGFNADPIMTWWNRLHVDTNAKLEVHVSYKLDTPPTTLTAPLTYGDDEVYGWSTWINAEYVESLGEFNYGWVRRQINLRYVNDKESASLIDLTGKRVRVRFVLNANASTTNQDGWWLDDVQFSVGLPRIFTLPFVDNAESMSNWIGEGSWGLDVDISYASSVAPSFSNDTGWLVKYMNCEWRPDISQDPPVAASTSMESCGGSVGSNILLTNPAYNVTKVTSGDDAYSTYNGNNQWYLADSINGNTINLDFGTGKPVGAPDNYGWEDNFVAEFTRDVTVSQKYTYTFYARSDDGMRLGVSPYPSEYITNLPSGSNTYDNIFNKWFDTAPRLYTANVTLGPNANGTARTYRFTAHYYEHVGLASFALGLGNKSASFSDTPTNIPGTSRTKMIQLSNTSLILDGLLDLRGVRKPLLEFYRQSRVDSNPDANAYVEISRDGGFTWVRDDASLRQNLTLSDGTVISASSGTNWSDNRTTWELRRHGLTGNIGYTVALRWRLQVGATEAQLAVRTVDEVNGINIAAIKVFDLEPPSPVPAIAVHPPANLQAQLNTPKQIEVVATGARPITYQWYYGESGNISQPISGATDATLELPSSMISTLGTYKVWVRVTNTTGSSNSTTSNIEVVNCVAELPGDCNIYRINVGGFDAAARDGSRPNWAGTRDGASGIAYRVSGSSFQERSNIALVSSTSNALLAAAYTGSAPEELYERGEQRRDLSWNFPVDPGTYIIRLYLAERDTGNNRQMTATVNGTIAQFRDGIGTLRNFYRIIMSNELGSERDRAGLFQFEPIVVTGNNINLIVSRDGGSKDSLVSGIEILPVNATTPAIIAQPRSQTLLSDTTTLKVVATGLNLNFQWFQSSTIGDETNPVTTGIVNTIETSSGSSVLSVPALASGNRSYWVKVTGGQVANPQVVNSNLATLTRCATTGNGACGFWFINAGGPQVTAPDGTIWYADNSSTPIVSPTTIPITTQASGTGSNAWNNAQTIYIDTNHVPLDLAQTRRYLHASTSSLRNAYYNLTVPNGSYDVTIYLFDDDRTSTNETMDINIEGTLMCNNCYWWQDTSIEYAFNKRTYTRSVSDGQLSLHFYREAGYPVWAAIEVRPTGS